MAIMPTMTPVRCKCGKLLAESLTGILVIVCRHCKQRLVVDSSRSDTG